MCRRLLPRHCCILSLPVGPPVRFKEIELSAQYVGAEVIIEKGADLMSRWNDTSDCSLQPRLFEWLWRRFGPFAVDLFADVATARSDPITNTFKFVRLAVPACRGSARSPWTPEPQSHDSGDSIGCGEGALVSMEAVLHPERASSARASGLPQRSPPQTADDAAMGDEAHPAT